MSLRDLYLVLIGGLTVGDVALGVVLVISLGVSIQ